MASPTTPWSGPWTPCWRRGSRCPRWSPRPGRACEGRASFLTSWQCGRQWFQPMEALSKSAVAEATRAATRSQAAFELKGVVTPLTVMRLRTTSLNLIERQLRAKLLQMPHFFQDAPVLLDLGELAESLHLLPLP